MIVKFESDVKNILVISLTNLGDVILTTPVLSALREKFPNAFLAVVIGPKAEELFRGSRTINEVIVYDKKRMTFFDRLQWVYGLRKRRFDLAVDLRNTLIPYLIGARQRTRFVIGKQPILMREKHLSRIKFLGGFSDSGNHQFDFFSEDDERRLHLKLKLWSVKAGQELILIVPGAGSYLKRWPVSRFGEVARYFTSKGKQVMIVGSQSERALAEQIKTFTPIVNACGSLTLRELASLLPKAALVLSCDSAIMHLAYEQNAPVVAIFGPTDEKKYGRLSPNNRIVRRKLDCAPCERAHCRFERQACMEDISSDEVIRNCEELLSVSAPH